MSLMETLKTLLERLLGLFFVKKTPPTPIPASPSPEPTAETPPVEDEEATPRMDPDEITEETDPPRKEPDEDLKEESTAIPEWSPKELDKPIPQSYVNEAGEKRVRYYTGWGSAKKPSVIVVHYSAGFTAQGCMDVLIKRGLSVQCSIERDGVIWRHTPDDTRCFHAGGSTWAGKSYLNNHSLGFEIVNMGWMKGLNDPPKRSFHREEVREDPEGRSWYRVEGTTRVKTHTTCGQPPDHRAQWDGYWWSLYTEDQIVSVFWQIWQWMKKYDILPENVVGHEHIAPANKSDPGPAFPWSKLGPFIDSHAKHEKPELLDPNHRKKERIKAVQSHCARMGLQVGYIDGVWGSKTEGAVQAAFSRYAEFYRLGSPEVSEDNCLELCRALRQVPGFDPGR